MSYIYTGRKDDSRYEYTSAVVEDSDITTWRETSLEESKCPILFTNGCFDVLHPGHIRVFHTMKRRNPNSALIVGLNSDNSIKRLKGDNSQLEAYATRLASGLQEQIKYSQELTRLVEKLETQLTFANEDANRLATELELEQNPGYKSRALTLHYKRDEYVDFYLRGK